MFKKIRPYLSAFVLVAFIGSSIQMPAYAQSAGSPNPWMPKPGTRLALSPEFTPAHLKGLVIHPENALQFDFIIHKGDEVFTEEEKKAEYNKVIKYFLASLAVPDDNQWVNLSPYEKDRIIKEDFGKTEMGRDLLAQDYILKQITASLIYPESNLGQKFWDTVYSRAQQQYGTTNIPVNTFNKVWIVPDEAYLYEHGNTVYIVRQHLKVMLEQDYLSLAKHSGITHKPQHSEEVNQLGSQIVKEIVLPELEKEVNEGKNFAMLRQVYSGALLAAWYKRTLKESLLGKIYADKTKVKGIDQDPKNNEEIYQQYLKAFKKGVFNYIKEDVDKFTHEAIPRKYFSGGSELFSEKNYDHSVKRADDAMANEVFGREEGSLEAVSTRLKEEQTVSRLNDRAMTVRVLNNSVKQIAEPVRIEAETIGFILAKNPAIMVGSSFVGVKAGVYTSANNNAGSSSSWNKFISGQYKEMPEQRFENLKKEHYLTSLQSFVPGRGLFTYNVSEAPYSGFFNKKYLLDLMVITPQENYAITFELTKEQLGQIKQYLNNESLFYSLSLFAGSEGIGDIAKKYNLVVSKLLNNPEEPQNVGAGFLGPFDIKQTQIIQTNRLDTDKTEPGTEKVVSKVSIGSSITKGPITKAYLKLPYDNGKQPSQMTLFQKEVKGVTVGNQVVYDITDSLRNVFSGEWSLPSISSLELWKDKGSLPSRLDGEVLVIRDSAMTNNGIDQAMSSDDEKERLKKELEKLNEAKVGISLSKEEIDSLIEDSKRERALRALNKQDAILEERLKELKRISGEDSSMRVGPVTAPALVTWFQRQDAQHNVDLAKQAQEFQKTLAEKGIVTEKVEDRFIPSPELQKLQVLEVLMKDRTTETVAGTLAGLGLTVEENPVNLGAQTFYYVQGNTIKMIGPTDPLRPSLLRSIREGTKKAVYIKDPNPPTNAEGARSMLHLTSLVFDAAMSLSDHLANLATLKEFFTSLDTKLKDGGKTLDELGLAKKETRDQMMFSMEVAGIPRAETWFLSQGDAVWSLQKEEDGKTTLVIYSVFQKKEFKIPLSDHIERITTTLDRTERLQKREQPSLVGAAPTDSAMKKGGIDLNTANLNLQIKRDGKGIPLPVAQQDWEHINIDGLVPVILDIKPAVTLPIFSELKNPIQTASG
jgi:hypothetical protein